MVLNLRCGFCKDIVVLTFEADNPPSPAEALSAGFDHRAVCAPYLVLAEAAVASLPVPDDISALV
jgi:hypothetical protein